MNIKDPITSFVGYHVWMFCEHFNLPLGNFAPIVFGWMIGRKGKKVTRGER